MEETPWATPAQEMYLISGLANEQFDLRGLRDRIRAGELTAEEEISLVGSNIWKPAAQYAALTRYFALAQKAAVSPTVQASNAASSPPAKGRIIAGFIYPFTSITAILFMLIGFATALNPLFAIPVSLSASLFSLAIIRASSEGETKAPEIDKVGGILDWILDTLRLLAAAFISAWPFLIVVLLAMVGKFSMALVFVAGCITLLYYPACLIAIGRWKQLSMALSVRTIFGLISTLGSDYYLAVVVFIALAFAASIATRPIAHSVGVKAARGLLTVARLFTSFYVSHLLGWAVYRHRDELE